MQIKSELSKVFKKKLSAFYNVQEIKKIILKDF